MIINTDYNINYNYGLYYNKPAYKDFYNQVIYVFKDISAKRINTKNNFNSDSKLYKIVFVTNKRLLSMDYFNEIKDCVFDGKIGTRYATKCCIGSYHFCLRQGGELPKCRN